jgi:hypothetical protein
MKKYLEYIITLSVVCGIIFSSIGFSWKYFGIPKVNEIVDPIKKENKFLRFVIMQSVTEKRYDELKTKFQMLNGYDGNREKK